MIYFQFLNKIINDSSQYRDLLEMIELSDHSNTLPIKQHVCTNSRIDCHSTLELLHHLIEMQLFIFFLYKQLQYCSYYSLCQLCVHLKDQREVDRTQLLIMSSYKSVDNVNSFYNLNFFHGSNMSNCSKDSIVKPSLAWQLTSFLAHLKRTDMCMQCTYIAAYE